MPSRKTVRFLRGVCAAIALAALSKYAAAATYFVSPCGNDGWAGLVNACSGPFGSKRTIQAAINAASSGDQISVGPGTYVGTIDTDGKAIRIFGSAGPAVTTLDGNGAAHVVTINSLEGAATIIEGLTITGGDSPTTGGGVLIALANPTFINCILSDNHADTNGGGVWVSLAGPTFTNCQFRINSADDDGGGLYAINSSVTLTDCIFDENEAANGGGIAFSGGNHDLDDCTVSDNHADSGGGGMQVRNNANVSMFDSDFTSNTSNHIGGGIYAFEGSDLTAVGGGAYSNAATNIGGGVALMTDATFEGDNFHIAGNSAALHGGGGAFVSNSDLQLTGATIWANTAASGADGVGGAVKMLLGATAVFDECDFVANTATGSGGALHVVQSSCTINDSDFSNQESDASGGAVWAHDGLLHVANTTFAGGLAHDHGGAVALSAMSIGGAATFDNCTFTDNESFELGGAMYGIESSIDIDSCAFPNNHGDQSGGAISIEGVTPHEVNLRDTVLQSNTTTTGGGAMRVVGSTEMTMLRCDVMDNVSANAGGGVYFWGQTLRMDACRVIGNSGTQGAGVSISNNSHGRLVNCVITENVSSSFGGGVLIGSTAVGEIINCTITGNSAVSTSSGIHNSGEMGLIRNSIVWGNSGTQIGGNALLDVRYSIVPRGITGLGCINADPQFVDAVARNFALTAGSPAIDAGLNWLLPADDLDADGDGDSLERIDGDHEGNARVAEGVNGACLPAAIVDIGAIEAPGAIGTVEDGDTNGDGVVNVSDLLAVISGWGNAFGCPHVDLNGDGTVNVTDLLIVISNWG